MHLIVYIHNKVLVSPLLEAYYGKSELQDMILAKKLLQLKESTGFDVMYPIMFSLLTNDVIMSSNRILYLSVNLNTISSNTFQILKSHHN
jgi:hypothetical protein